MKQITAEEFLLEGEENPTGTVFTKPAIEAMIEFAKLHVEKALKAAREGAENNIISYPDWENRPDIILTAYPLDKII